MDELHRQRFRLIEKAQHEQLVIVHLKSGPVLNEKQKAELTKRRETVQAVQGELRRINSEIARRKAASPPAPEAPPPPPPNLDELTHRRIKLAFRLLHDAKLSDKARQALQAELHKVDEDIDLVQPPPAPAADLSRRTLAALREVVIERFSDQVWDELTAEANRRLKPKAKPAPEPVAKPTPPVVPREKALEVNRVIRAKRTLKARDHAMMKSGDGFVVYPLALPEPPPGSEPLSLDDIEARLSDPVWP